MKHGKSKLLSLHFLIALCLAMVGCAGEDPNASTELGVQAAALESTCEAGFEQCAASCEKTYDEENDDREIMNAGWRAECDDYCLDKLNACVGADVEPTVKQVPPPEVHDQKVSAGKGKVTSKLRSVDLSDKFDPEVGGTSGEGAESIAFAPGGAVGGAGGFGGVLSAWGCWESTCCAQTGLCRDGAGWRRCCVRRETCTRCIWPW